jgi:hypothetical protein
MLKPVLSSDAGKEHRNLEIIPPHLHCSSLPVPPPLPAHSTITEQKRRTSSASRGSRPSVSEEDDDDEIFLDEDDKDDVSWDESVSQSPRDRAVSDMGESFGASCSLIVSFAHSSPSFTVRSLYDTKVLKLLKSYLTLLSAHSVD